MDIQKAAQVLKVLNDGLNKEDFTRAYGAVVDYVKGTDKKLSDAFTGLSTHLHQRITDSHKHMANGIEAIKGQVDHVFVQDRVQKMEQEHAQRMALVDNKIASVRDGKDGKSGPQGPKGDKGQPAANITPEQIRAELQAMKDEWLKELTKSLPTHSTIAYSRGQVKYYDLSSQLNGSTKTFSLPAFWRIINVSSSSTPNAFRENVDYTVSQPNSQITFTSQIDAASTLAAGQTLTIIYAEG